MNLLSDDELEASAIVANCRMNRQRQLLGGNGYDKELGVNPIEFLQELATESIAPIRWLDLCCGTGRALIEMAEHCQGSEFEDRIEIVGIDLVDYFFPVPTSIKSLELKTASLSRWAPASSAKFDLITCVHGLHYIGDKLGLLERICGWLKPAGTFIGQLDLDNVRDQSGQKVAKILLQTFRKNEFDFCPRRRRLRSDGAKEISFERGIVERKQNDSSEPLWGIFYKEEEKEILDNKLPVSVKIVTPEDYVPNDSLVAILIPAVAEFNEDVEILKERETAGKKVLLSKKKIELLNALPAPIAEPLRKLLVPVAKEDEGFDKISLTRLKQLNITFTTTIEFIIFTLLAQLWEGEIHNEETPFYPNKLRSSVISFINMNEEERACFKPLPLIETLQTYLKEIESKYFVEELSEIECNEPFKDACLFFHLLSKRLMEESIQEHEIAEQCIRAEENLSAIYSQLGFIAKYTLAAVNKIDIQKFRHQTSATFNHTMVLFLNLLGGFSSEDYTLNRFTDNRSVLLLKMEDGEIISDLNLSPFIIDENAFEEKTDVSKIYFYSHFDESFKYKFINKLSDTQLDVRQKKYQPVKAQLDAFEELFQDP